jgi:hypothetical protein
MSPMNNRLLVPRKTPGLLDLVPGAAAAYSLRSLSNSYADPVVTVRRSSDDDEGSFTAAEVSDGTLAAFCGAGDGFVKQWWDQSGNARHATQTTPGYQPQIVDTGVVVTEEGKPAIKFDGTDDFLRSTSFPALGTSALSTFLLFRFFNSTGFRTPLHLGGATNNSGILYTADGVKNDGSMRVGRVGGDFLTTTTSTDFVATVLSGIRTGLTVFNLYFNGAATSPPSGNPIGMNIISGLSVGSYNGTSQFLDGTVSEVIVYSSDLSSQRELIEGNIAWSYSV